jgi:hypothetical protein
MTRRIVLQTTNRLVVGSKKLVIETFYKYNYAGGNLACPILIKPLEIFQNNGCCKRLYRDFSGTM